MSVGLFALFVLSTGISSALHVHSVATDSPTVVSFHDRQIAGTLCEVACGDGVDATCLPTCEFDMCKCFRSEMSENKISCHKALLTKYSNFGKNWENTHLLSVRRGSGVRLLTSVEQDAEAKICETACGVFDAGCISQCQVHLYGCLDFQSDGHRKACRKAVVDETEEFRDDFVGGGGENRSLKIQEQQLAASTCAQACHHHDDLSCAPGCQLHMYKCFDSTNVTYTQQCMASVHNKFQEPSKSSGGTRSRVLGESKRSEDPRHGVVHFATKQPQHVQLSVDEKRFVTSRCESACGPGVDSSCVPECQVQMYWCFDSKFHAAHSACQELVVNDFKGFGKNWNKTHPYFFAKRNQRVLTIIEQNASVERCEAACGEGVDSSCVPECQIQMYRCFDFTSKRRIDKCHADVTKAFEEFGATWDRIHPYVLTAQSSSILTTVEKESASALCASACGNGDPSCAPECEVHMYWCLNFQSKDHVRQCQGSVVTDFDEISGRGKSMHPYFFAKRSRRVLKDADQKTVTARCTGACGPQVDSSCHPECEVQMYWCFDFTQQAHVDHCHAATIKEFRTFRGRWDKTHPHSFAEQRHREHIAETRDVIESTCLLACNQTLDSTCLPECQVQMHWCADYGEDDSCQVDVVTKYKTQGYGWEDAHPYFFAKGTHRVLAATEEKAVAQDCNKTCGQNIDSSCVPQCEVQMYWCFDLKNESNFYQCQADVLEEFAAFGENWNSTHPYLFGMYDKKTLSAADKYAAVTKCKDACGDDSDSSCVPECEVQMYWCFDFRKSKRVHHCQNNVIEEFKTFSKVWDQRHPYFLNVAKRALAPGDKQVAHAKCDAACSPLAESTCVPQCELQMFWCFDFQDLASLNQCQTDVVGEFLVSSKMKNKTRRLRHPHPRHHHHYHGTMHSTATEAVTHLNNTAAATLEATELVHTIGSGGRPMGKLQGAEARCQDACHHNAHTGCTLECQVAMYWCLEANSTHDVSHCQQKVFLEYNTENIQGEDWNKEHPLSLPLP